MLSYRMDTSVNSTGCRPPIKMAYVLIAFLFVISAVNLYLYLNYSPYSKCLKLHLRVGENDFSKSEDGRRISGQKAKKKRHQIQIRGETEDENFENILQSGEYCFQVASYSRKETILPPDEETKERTFDSTEQEENVYENKSKKRESIGTMGDNGAVFNNAFRKLVFNRIPKRIRNVISVKLANELSKVDVIPGGEWKKKRSVSRVDDQCEIQVTPKVIEHEGGTREITNDLCIEKSTLEKYIGKTVNDSLETILGRIANESGKDGGWETKEENGQEGGGDTDCVLAKVEEDGSYRIPEDMRGKSFLLTIDPFRNESDDEFTVWIKEFRSPYLKEYGFQINGEYKLVDSRVLPGEFYKYGILYNGSFYSEYKELKVIGKYDLERKKMSTVKEMYDGFFFNDKIMFFFADEDGLWICYYSHRSYVVLRVDPENLEILSGQNNVSPDCYLYRVFVAHGRVYCVKDEEETINLLYDFYQRDVANVSVSFHPEEFSRYDYTFSYNHKTRRLYVYNENIFKRYKLHFKCSRHHSAPAGEWDPNPLATPTVSWE